MVKNTYNSVIPWSSLFSVFFIMSSQAKQHLFANFSSGCGVTPFYQFDYLFVSVCSPALFIHHPSIHKYIQNVNKLFYLHKRDLKWCRNINIFFSKGILFFPLFCSFIVMIIFLFWQFYPKKCSPKTTDSSIVYGLSIPSRKDGCALRHCLKWTSLLSIEQRALTVGDEISSFMCHYTHLVEFLCTCPVALAWK